MRFLSALSDILLKAYYTDNNTHTECLSEFSLCNISDVKKHVSSSSRAYCEMLDPIPTSFINILKIILIYFCQFLRE